MNSLNNDTICALATPPFMSAIGVIRVSGADCLKTVSSCFDKDLTAKPGGTFWHGFITDGEKTVDEAVISVFRAPKSYTGEDVAEISCHGSVFILDRVLKLLIKRGARQAERGEFSKRAFLNGKMDTVKAESVIDLIESAAEREASVAIEHLKGGLSAELDGIREELLGLSAQIMASVDYPDDEIEELEPDKLKKTLSSLHDRVKRLTDSFDTGRLIKNGLHVCISGKPNVGKSSLMNRLSGYERSIVTDIEGTTRDIIEETVALGGFKVILSDTAGIRDTTDRVEKIGVERATDALRGAELVLAVFDGGANISEEDNELMALLGQIKAKKIAVINKSDLPAVLNEADLKGFDRTVRASATEKDGVSELIKAITDIFTAGAEPDDSRIITNERQYQCLVRAEKALERCVHDVLLPPDVVEIYIEDAAEALAVTLGRSVSEDVLSTIFSRFCVGK